MPIYNVLAVRSGRVSTRRLRRQVFRIVVLLNLTLAVCAVGLFAMDSSSDLLPHKAMRAVWNSLNLVTTLGDFSGLDQRAMGFMMATMVTFMMVGGYAISSLSGILSSDARIALRENKRMEHKLERLTNHVIVIGFGPVGRLVAGRLQAAGEQVVIIERADAMATEASDLGYLVVQGDAGMDPGVFELARIGHAKALVVTTEEPDRMLAITLTAHSCNPTLKISATGANSQHEALLRRAGASEVAIADELVANAVIDRLFS
jgi:hypothetical protein